MPIIPFGNLDDLFDEMRKQNEKAGARVKPWQIQIKPGDYFYRWNKLGFAIYGEILAEDEPREPNLAQYRLCKAYSQACPAGEMGDIHISTIEKLITKGEFEEAKKKGWNT